MRTKIISYTIYIYIIILLQSTLMENIRVFNVKPNLMIIFIVSVALLRGNVEGAIIGFFMGLCQDALSGKVIGFYSLVGLYLGLIIGSVNKRLYRENFLVIIFFTFVSTIVYEFVVYFLNTFSINNIEFVFPFRNFILPEAIYNSFVSIFVYIFVVNFSRKLESTNKVQRKY